MRTIKSLNKTRRIPKTKLLRNQRSKNKRPQIRRKSVRKPTIFSRVSEPLDSFALRHHPSVSSLS